jgi:hypothetical protein
LYPKTISIIEDGNLSRFPNYPLCSLINVC